MDKSTAIVKHGLKWILQATLSKSLQCPECVAPKTNLRWEILDLSPANTTNQIVAAACCCEICGCEFTITREADEEV